MNRFGSAWDYEVCPKCSNEDIECKHCHGITNNMPNKKPEIDAYTTAVRDYLGTGFREGLDKLRRLMEDSTGEQSRL